MSTSPDLIVVNASVFTADTAGTRAEAFAVTDGVFTAVGASTEVAELAGPDTQVIDLAGGAVMPGICDVHTHLGLGGIAVAWDIPFPPTADLEEICAAVSARAAELAPGEWITGGIVGATTLQNVANVDALAALDAASAGHPVLLKEETNHNRWVNSAALAVMGVGENTPDPEGGTYVRDAAGRLTGVLWEQASLVAEEAFLGSIEDLRARHRVTFATAVRVCNEMGITTACDAATMEPALHTLAELEDEGQLTLRVVTSTVARQLLAEPGITGAELVEVSDQFGSDLLRIGFVKLFLDGIPVTRTSAMLDPYLPDPCCPHGEPDRGECLYTLDELIDEMEQAVTAGRGVKIHAAGDGSTRRALDAIAEMRRRHGDAPKFHIAHTGWIAPSDVPRFAELGVVADASPYLWFPSPLSVGLTSTLSDEVIDRSWPLKDFLDSGANVAAGSDWPVADQTPQTWTGIETMVTRQAPGGGEKQLNPGQALSLEEAVVSFTRRSAEALGLGDVTGSIEIGKSADFLFLSQDLFDVDVHQIHKTVAQSVYLRGALVHSA